MNGSRFLFCRAHDVFKELVLFLVIAHLVLKHVVFLIDVIDQSSAARGVCERVPCIGQSVVEVSQHHLIFSFFLSDLISDFLLQIV